MDNTQNEDNPLVGFCSMVAISEDMIKKLSIKILDTWKDLTSVNNVGAFVITTTQYLAENKKDISKNVEILNGDPKDMVSRLGFETVEVLLESKTLFDFDSVSEQSMTLLLNAFKHSSAQGSYNSKKI